MSFSPSSSSPSLGNRIQEQRDKWDRKRTRTTKELVQTEQKYCQQLQLITNGSSGAPGERVLGRGFDQFCPELHHYRVYVDNFYSAQRILRTQLKKSKAFRRFKKLQESRAEFRVRAWRSCWSCLSTESNRAVGALSDLHERILDNTRRHENMLQLQRVQRLLRGSKIRVMSPDRWFLREGFLKVVPPKGSDAKLQMFFLFSDVLLQTRRSSALSLSSEERFELRRAFPLKDCVVEKVFGHTRSQGGLLNLSFPKAKLLLMSTDQEDFNNWFNLLSSAVRKLQSKPTEIHNKPSDSSSAIQRKRHALSEMSPEAVMLTRKRAAPQEEETGACTQQCGNLLLQLRHSVMDQKVPLCIHLYF
ncbi:hypothetical protein WMY93_019581 [Mugilogobius chulae]|uniref:PH domain-containing protein n=1 Tax=Mugilogobius chulae TaxID=88201 RepID=A0AAW0NHI7_9GOBI